MKQLNILLANFEFPPYPLAGTGTYALVLVKALTQLGHHVTILTPNHSGQDGMENVEGATVKRVDVSGIQLINKFMGQAKTNRSFLDKKTLFALALKNYIKKNLNLNDYDLFHSLNERDAAFLDFKYMNKHLPTILSVNDYYIIGSSLNPMKFEFKSTDLPLRYAHHNFMKRFYMKALKNCTAIIPNSYFVGNLIKEVAHIPPEKIHVVQRGINTHKFDLTPAKNKYTSKKVLFVGPNAERKGAIFVLQAAPAILKVHPETTFTFIGSCPWRYKQKINNFIKEHYLQSKVTYLEHVPQDQLLPYYEEANVFVMPSIMEAMGQVYMEAMTSRTPVIGANVGGVGEIITPEVGYLVPSRNPEAIAEKIITLFSDPKLAKEMGDNGHERATDHFTIERQMKETLAVYNAVTKK
ncbi:MAG: glycosyltransferase family 4 protein [Candidatus Nanoarchaeia archaeon]